MIAKTIALLLSELRRCADGTLAASAGPMIQHSKQAAHLGEVAGLWQRALTGTVRLQAEPGSFFGAESAFKGKEPNYRAPVPRAVKTACFVHSQQSTSFESPPSCNM